MSSVESIMSTVRMLERLKGIPAPKGEALKAAKENLLYAARDVLHTKRTAFSPESMDAFEKSMETVGATFCIGGKTISGIADILKLPELDQAVIVNGLRTLSKNGNQSASYILQELSADAKWKSFGKKH